MKVLFRPAIAMIELIFAIVVMGIVLMSAPTLIGVATQSGSSGSTASLQESITEVSSLVKLITTRYWDQNDTNNSAPILHVVAPIGGNEFPGRVSRRKFNSDGNRLMASPIRQEDGFNDMDDFNGRVINMNLTMAEIGIAGETDYIDFAATLTSNVQYGQVGIPGNEPFTAPGGNNLRNTKLITVSLTSPRFPDKNISLSTFSCNIGSYQLQDLGANR